jgi:hypothetical protein
MQSRLPLKGDALAMNCQSVRAHLVDEWEELEGEFRIHDVQQHLDGCAACRRVAAEYAHSHRWLQSLPVQEPPENFEWRLRLRLNQIDREGADALREARHEEARSTASMPFIGSAVAAAVVVLAVGFVSLRSPDSGVPGDGAPSMLAQEVERTVDQAADAPEVRLQWAADRPGLPNLAPSRPGYLKVVPVSSGVPLGPDTQTPPAPSILGEDILRLPAPLPR